MVHLIEGEREKIIKQIPEDVKNREAACCEMQKSDGERQVLKKQARRARTNHLVKSSMEPGERKTRRKPVLELFVDGAYTENTEDWQKEPQKHCESVYVDPEEKIGTVQKMGGPSRCRLIWFCKPEPN